MTKANPKNPKQTKKTIKETYTTNPFENNIVDGVFFCLSISFILGASILAFFYFGLLMALGLAIGGMIIVALSGPLGPIIFGPIAFISFIGFLFIGFKIIVFSIAALIAYAVFSAVQSGR